jgi:uncharacterized membrane protein YecN with MAPEG domain
MIDGLLLLFKPGLAWDRIGRSQHGVLFVLFTFLLPIMVLSSSGEAYGLVHWGKWQGQVPHLRRFSMAEATVAEGLQFALSLLLVIVNASMLRSTGSTFHTRHTFRQSFAAVAYGLTPLFLLRLLNAFPDVPSWLTWVVGIFLCFALLYHGVPLVMQPDPAHAFGLYVTTMLLLFCTTGMAELGKAAYLSGNFPKVEQFISDAAARLPF